MIRISLLIMALVLLPAVGLAQTATIACRYTTGTAPHLVNCDILSSTGWTGDVYHDVRTEWDFGDPASGSWTTSGLPRNTDEGPLASHVYAAAGSYTITVRMTDDDGDTDQDTESITVNDSDDNFPTTQTVCVSTSGTFTDCPSGATQDTNSDFDNALATNCDITGNDNNCRYLFRVGETFTVSAAQTPIAIIGTTNQKHIGSFGTGAKPTVDASLLGSTNQLFNIGSGQDDLSGRFTIYGINFQGADHETASHAIFDDADGLDRVLLYDLDVNDWGATVAMASAGGGTSPASRDVGFVELAVDSNAQNCMGHQYTTYTTMLGVSCTNSVSSSSDDWLIRIASVWWYNIGHVSLSSAAAGVDRSIFKMSGVDFTGQFIDNPFGGDDELRYVYWHDSTFDYTANSSSLVGGYNLGSTGIYQDFLMRRVFSFAQGTSGGFFRLSVQNLTMNDVISIRDSTANPFIQDTKGGTDPLYEPTNWHIEGNTFVLLTDTTATNAISMLADTQPGTSAGHELASNLYYTPDDPTPPAVTAGCGSGGVVCDYNADNHATDTDVFLDDGTFDEADDAILDSGVGEATTSLIDQGRVSIPPHLDYGFNCRDATPDIGAWEDGANQACLFVLNPIFGGSLGGGIQ